jgi:hypothetical protein
MEYLDLQLSLIRPGFRVTVRDRFGVEHTGRAVMRGPHGWVLNMGGKHGAPLVTDGTNIVRVRIPRDWRPTQL